MGHHEFEHDAKLLKIPEGDSSASETQMIQAAVVTPPRYVWSPRPKAAPASGHISSCIVCSILPTRCLLPNIYQHLFVQWAGSMPPKLLTLALALTGTFICLVSTYGIYHTSVGRLHHAWPDQNPDQLAPMELAASEDDRGRAPHHAPLSHEPYHWCNSDTFWLWPICTTIGKGKQPVRLSFFLSLTCSQHRI